MKKLRPSTWALIGTGAAIVALGTTLALSAPADFWTDAASRRESRWSAPAERPDLDRSGYGFRGMRYGYGMGHGPAFMLFPAFLVGTGVGILAGRGARKNDAEGGSE